MAWQPSDTIAVVSVGVTAVATIMTQGFHLWDRRRERADQRELRERELAEQREQWETELAALNAQRDADDLRQWRDRVTTALGQCHQFTNKRHAYLFDIWAEMASDGAAARFTEMVAELERLQAEFDPVLHELATAHPSPKVREAADGLSDRVSAYLTSLSLLQNAAFRPALPDDQGEWLAMQRADVPEARSECHDALRRLTELIHGETEAPSA